MIRGTAAVVLAAWGDVLVNAGELLGACSRRIRR